MFPKLCRKASLETEYTTIDAVQYTSRGTYAYIYSHDIFFLPDSDYIRCRFWNISNMSTTVCCTHKNTYIHVYTHKFVYVIPHSFGSLTCLLHFHSYFTFCPDVYICLRIRHFNHRSHTRGETVYFRREKHAEFREKGGRISPLWICHQNHTSANIYL